MKSASRRERCGSRWSSAAIICVCLASCGPSNGFRVTNADAAQGGNGTQTSGAGGVASSGGVGSTGGIGGNKAQGTGGVWITTNGGGGARTGGAGGGSAGQDGPVADAEIMLLPDGACGDEYPLFWGIAHALGAGYCLRPGDGGVEQGHVVLDGEGQVVDNSYYGCDRDGSCGAAGLQEFLASLAGYRWPCLAGHTVGYYCVTM
jgi:hypothetical protein